MFVHVISVFYDISHTPLQVIHMGTQIVYNQNHMRLHVNRFSLNTKDPSVHFAKYLTDYGKDRQYSLLDSYGVLYIIGVLYKVELQNYSTLGLNYSY